MERMKVMFGHITPASLQPEEVKGRSPSKFADSPDDICVVSALRTPIAKAKRGAFKDTHGDDLLSQVFTAVIKDAKINPADIGDICVGNVGDGRSAFTARVAQFFSGIPETVPVSSVNRQCSSGLQAFMNIAGGIRNGAYDIGLAAGVEMMSKNTIADRKQFSDLNPKIFEVDNAKDCLIPMGITSENVAKKFGITREEQDRFSLESHKRAAIAQEQGLFDAEIIPVTVSVMDKDGNERTVTVTKDEGVRAGTTMEILGKLQPAFEEGGSTTAGNSSQVSDGAAGVLVVRRSEAIKRGMPILGVLRGFAVAGVPPEIMGIGPAVAIPKVLERAGLTVDDIDIFEINEAFASQAYYSMKKLGIPHEKVNPKGGAIALGHPLGCTGARQIGTLLHELKRRGKRGLGVISMCIGTGMGAAALFEYPGN
ncbi:hypothetical protein ACJMK2_023932 [Sinanodonta woodiana]|uniref:Uncharacterized protein n=1 Tax=Sinanodonta woodiana TaxID=1069815 RepID=A0ABD3T746_SINWO